MARTPKKVTPRSVLTQRKCQKCQGTGYVGSGQNEKKCPAKCNNGVIVLGTL